MVGVFFPPFVAPKIVYIARAVFFVYTYVAIIIIIRSKQSIVNYIIVSVGIVRRRCFSVLPGETLLLFGACVCVWWRRGGGAYLLEILFGVGPGGRITETSLVSDPDTFRILGPSHHIALNNEI